MRLHLKDGSVRVDFDGGGSLSLSYYNQWPAVLRPGDYNWVDFTFVRAHAEYATYASRAEVNLSLLGLNFEAWYDAPPTPLTPDAHEPREKPSASRRRRKNA